MTDWLEMIWKNSLAGTVFIFMILVIRYLTKNYSKIYVRILWIMLLLELLAPPITKSPINTFRNLDLAANINQQEQKDDDKTEEQTVTNIATQKQQTIMKDSFSYEIQANKIQENTNLFTWNYANRENQEHLISNSNFEKMSMELSQKENTSDNLLTQKNTTNLTILLSFLWIAGATFVSMTYLEQYISLKNKIFAAIRVESKVWVCENTDMPFVMLGIPSNIYLPLNLKGKAREHVLAHEQQHIKNFDPWLKFLALFATIIHWFNPFVWLAFFLFGKDLELYCDECVLRRKSLEERKEYSQNLLNFSLKANRLSPILYFGESDTKSRVKHILYRKKTKVVAAIALCLVLAGCGVTFLTASKETSNTKDNENLLDTSNWSSWYYTDVVGKEGEGITSINGVNLETLLSEADDYTDNGADDWYFSLPWISFLEEYEFIIKHFMDSEDSDGQAAWLEINKKQEELNTAIYLIGQTDHSLIYSGDWGNNIIVKTFDNTNIYAEIAIISSAPSTPCYLETDFDKDGDLELAIITYTGTGTGISLQDLYLADKSSDGLWCLYHLSQATYLSAILPRCGTEYLEDGVCFQLDGQSVSEKHILEAEMLQKSGTQEQGYYTLGNFISFEYTLDNEISLIAKVYYEDEDIFPAFDHAAGYLKVQVEYMGNGNWNLEQCEFNPLEMEETEIQPTVKPPNYTKTIYHSGGGYELKNYEIKYLWADKLATAEDHRESDYEDLPWVIYANTQEGDPEYLNTLACLIDETEHFKVYSVNYGASTIVQISDGAVVLAEDTLLYSAVSSQEQKKPICLEADFDQDGENELAIITYTDQGNDIFRDGIYINCLYMVDKYNDAWYMHTLSDSDHADLLNAHYSSESNKNSVSLFLDGNMIDEISIAEETGEYKVGRHFSVEFLKNNQIELKTRVVYNLSGTHDHIVGDIVGTLSYDGSGEWSLENVHFQPFEE